MGFDRSLWTRLEFEGTPIYIREDQPNWFVPNRLGDKFLNNLAGDAASGIREQRFLQRLPDAPPADYPGRSHFLSTDVLKETWFHITNRCNQSCSHCMFGCSSETADEMPADVVLNLAKQAYGLGCRVFALTGGEPFAHREFERVVDELLDLADTHVAVLTNGTLLRKHADPLDRWPVRQLHLQVSVDGVREAHDRIRGEGAFETLDRNLRFLRERGFPFTVSMCVEKSNLDSMPDIVDFAAASGASNVHFMWYFIRGRGTEDQFPDLDRLFDRFRESVERAEAVGISVDNAVALKSQIFTPVGTIFDGTGAGWDSLAVGPDGKVYPSPAMIGAEELATDISNGLASAWRNSPILQDIRSATAKELRGPLRFLTGGGDSDHSYFRSRRFTGGDPYSEFHEKCALWLMAREASKQPDAGPPRLRLKMGDVLESCGAHGEVALTHSNCLLAVAHTDSRTSVAEFYTSAARAVKRDIANPVHYPEETIRHIPEQFRFRGYGCGSPVIDAGIEEGHTVVDLGSGTGIECFIASGIVLSAGRVIGVDMLDPMLEEANRALDFVSVNLGYRNVEFRKGFLESLPIEDKTADVVISNCVLNLSSNKRETFSEMWRILKPGGRLVVSDVVCDDDPGAAVRNNEALKGECIGGALTQKDLFGLMEETGFVSAQILKRFPYRIVHNHPFFSLTFEACKPLESESVNVMYRGPFAAAMTDDGKLLTPGSIVQMPKSEAERFNGHLLFLDEHSGAVTNFDMGASCCCSSVGQEDEGQTGRCCETTFDETNSSSCDCGAPDAESSVAEAKQSSGCMVCGSQLLYPGVGVSRRCMYCGKTFESETVCENGHYVCDGCHIRDGMTAIREICLRTEETDMIRLLATVRDHPSIPVHGPEHHAMVPGIILATYRNLGGRVTDEMILQGIERGAEVPGGYCGFMGACGAALGVGIAYGVILESTPMKGCERRSVQTATKFALDAIAAFEAARCCQRDSWLALKAAANISKDHLPVALKADAEFHCKQQHLNQECIGTVCPVFT